MASKFYAVKVGIRPGIYKTWIDCKKNVEGFPGAVYKGFPTEKEAEIFLGILEKEKDIVDSEEKFDVIAYVDGSYSEEKGEYSYGVVLFHNGKEEHFSEKFSNSDLISMRNVAGEIEGSKRAMKYCNDNNISSLKIIYDYEGIEKWCTGEWKTKKRGTIEYKKYYDGIKENVKISFTKVKGHSGNRYNDLADKLAKGALGIGDYCNKIANNNNGITANNIKYDDLIKIIELLKEDFDIIDYKEKEIPYGKEHKIFVSYKGKTQNLTINYYTEKKKICIIGNKEEELFNQLSLYIIELLELDEIPEFLNTVHELNVNVDIVECDFKNYFPNSYNILPKEISRYLHQAVYNLHIMGNMYVSNFLVEPAIRPLEGVLKIALQENDIPIRQENKNYDCFFVFKIDKDKYILNKKYVKSSHSIELLDYLSEIYTYYYRNRHTLFHWDNPKHDLDTTRILNTVQEAHTIIKDSINLIDKYYKIRKI